MQRFDRYSDDAKRALFFSRAAVSEHGGMKILDAHLLLGTLQASPNVVAQFLEFEGAVQSLRECLLAAIVSPQLVTRETEIPLDDGAIRILDGAEKAVTRFGHQVVTPEHLLFAILSEEDGPAAACLRRAGVSREHVAATLSKGRQGC